MKILLLFLKEKQYEEEARHAFKVLEDNNGLVDVNEL